MSSEKLIQGVLPIGTSTIYSIPSVGGLAKVYYIKFYNPVAYDITLSRYQSTISSTLDLYSLNLAAGDSITDSSSYLLSEFDELKVTTSVAGTSYFIYLYSSI
jgi:hypothetical protein